MSSSYINNFTTRERETTLTIIDEFENGNSLKHYIKRFVSDNVYSKNLVDWKRRYVTSNYMSHMVENYLGYVQPLTDINRRFMRTPAGKVDVRKEELVNQFFRLNSWNSLFKLCAAGRKKHGDVYLYWHLVDLEDGRTYPKLEFMDSRYMTPKQDENGLIFAYVYERTVEYDEESINGEFTKESKVIKWIFGKGGIDIYEDGIFLENVKNRDIFSEEIPILHLQFMKEPLTPYSKIPAESFIDLCLDLDRIESDIALINTLMGAPQMIIIDGKVDTDNSAFGPNAIFYVDSILTDVVNGVSKQAKVQQLEIGNDLMSLVNERNSKLEILYDKANLISPEIYRKLATTDSSKVWDSVRKDLEQEIKDFYIEMIDKFEIIFRVLFSVNKMALPKTKMSVSFELPEYIIEKTVFDKYLLKAQKMSIGELSMRENLRNEGLTEREIDRLMSEYNEEFLEKNKDISTTATNTQPKTSTTKPKDVKEVIPVSTANSVATAGGGVAEAKLGVDNNVKKVK